MQGFWGDQSDYQPQNIMQLRYNTPSHVLILFAIMCVLSFKSGKSRNSLEFEKNRAVCTAH